MAKTELTFDQLILEKRTTDPATPASGKFALYNKNGGVYAKDDSGSVAGMSNTANALVYLSSPSIVANTGQWDISLPTGYKMLRMRMTLQSMATAIQGIYLRFDDDATAGDYRSVGYDANVTTAIALGYVPPSNNTIPMNFLDIDIWDYEDANVQTQVSFHAANNSPSWNINWRGSGLKTAAETNSTLNILLASANLGVSSAVIWGLKEA
ncbi:MAG: hypothetical protein AAFR67_04375 [Chloroflexota bacterium]